jgi:hypothetical protein
VSDRNTFFAALPDGRLWIKTLAFNVHYNYWWKQDFETLAPGRMNAEYIGGSNWVEVAADNFQALGVRSDGSLWSLQRKWNRSEAWWTQTGDFRLTQIGSETNWLQVVGNQFGFLLLKKEGNLWIWGTNGYNWNEPSNSIPKKLKLDLITLPTRISGETNWTKVFSPNTDRPKKAYAKNDGDHTWELAVKVETNSVRVSLQSTNINDAWASFASSDWQSVGINTNGELWYFESEWKSNEYIPRGKIKLGQNAKWKAATFSDWNSITAIRSDGTLWKWSPVWNLSRNPDLVKPVQFGTHSDWIALPVRFYLGSVALAADGGLWLLDEPSEHIWLAPSRKPVFIGNIFQGAELKAE